MAKDDQQEAYEKLMAASLARVLDFLKFAEAKNAALVTFSSAWILGSISLLASDKVLPPKFESALKLDIVILGAAAICAFVAILPKMKLSMFTGTAAPVGAQNLLYFGHIAELGTEALKDRFKRLYMPDANKSATDAYLDDLAEQIAVNSQIVRRKFRLFDMGARLAAVAVLVLLWPAVCIVSTWIWTAFK